MLTGTAKKSSPANGVRPSSVRCWKSWASATSPPIAPKPKGGSSDTGKHSRTACPRSFRCMASVRSRRSMRSCRASSSAAEAGSPKRRATPRQRGAPCHATSIESWRVATPASSGATTSSASPATPSSSHEGALGDRSRTLGSRSANCSTAGCSCCTRVPCSWSTRHHHRLSFSCREHRRSRLVDRNVRPKPVGTFPARGPPCHPPTRSQQAIDKPLLASKHARRQPHLETQPLQTSTLARCGGKGVTESFWSWGDRITLDQQVRGVTALGERRDLATISSRRNPRHPGRVGGPKC